MKYPRQEDLSSVIIISVILIVIISRRVLFKFTATYQPCPMSLDIPHLLSLYNEHAYTGGGFIAPMALSALPPEKQPSACLKCRSCEQVCPQQIKISEVLADFSEKLG